jgi:hypothetical protein
MTDAPLIERLKAEAQRFFNRNELHPSPFADKLVVTLEVAALEAYRRLITSDSAAIQLLNELSQRHIAPVLPSGDAPVDPADTWYGYLGWPVSRAVAEHLRLTVPALGRLDTERLALEGALRI